MPPQRSSSALLIVITIGCFVLAALLIIVLGLRDRKKDLALGDLIGTPGPTASAPVVGSAAPAPTASAAPTTTVAATTATTAAPTTPPTATVRAPAPTTTTNTTPSPKSHGHSTPTPVRTAVTPSKPSAPPAPAEDNGFLTISSYPWAKVTEGGRSVCTTPCNKVPMSPGTHTLTVENGETPGQKQTVTVQIKSNETSTKYIGFK